MKATAVLYDSWTVGGLIFFSLLVYVFSEFSTKIVHYLYTLPQIKKQKEISHI